MKINVLLIILCFLIFSNCKHREKEDDCIRLVEIEKNDQKYRILPLFSKLNYVADSLRRLNSIDVNYREYIIYHYQPAMELMNNNPDLDYPNEYLFDSVNQLQYELDLKNTKFLMDFISNTDYAKLDTLKCFHDALLALVHTPDELIPDVKNLIAKHKGKIPTENLKHINWHLNGRISFD